MVKKTRNTESNEITRTNETSTNKLTSYIKRIMVSNGCKTKSRLSEKSGLPYMTVSSILQSDNNLLNAKVKNLAAICKALDITMDSVLNYEDFCSLEDEREEKEELEQNEETHLQISEQELLERELSLIKREKRLLRREEAILSKALRN